MSKLAGYVLLISILVLLFSLFGLTSGSSLVAFLLNPSDYSSTALYTAIIAMTVLLVVSGIVSYFVSGGDKMDFVMMANTGMIALFLGLANELLSIFSVLAEGSIVLAAIFVSPLFYMYLMAVIEWWRGVG
jgi:hypothetical protein